MNEYDISVIINVYNSENTIRKCINSVLVQSYDFSKIQVLLVDNASTDNSPSICKNYAYAYSNIEYYFEPQQGGSYAKNKGLEMAKGQYIMFLEADAYISKNAVKSVKNFFEQHCDEIDLVTYHENRIVNKKVDKEHVRYNYLTKTGIYDLSKVWYVLPTRTCICVKNNLDVCFEPSVSIQCNQKYCADILLKKRKLGYVKEAEYSYVSGVKSFVEYDDSPLLCFETALKTFEILFSTCTNTEGEIPYYVQAMFLHDCVWKFRVGRLWPYHYEEQKLRQAKERVVNLLRHVDDDVIMNYPDLDSYEKVYWIKLKDNQKFSYVANKQKVCLYADEKELHSRLSVEIILEKVVVQKEIVKVRGYIKSSLCEFCKTELNIIVNGEIREITLVDCGAGYYKAKEKTNTFWGFEFATELREETEIQFKVAIDGNGVNTVFYNMSRVAFDETLKSYFTGNVIAEQTLNSLIFRKLGDEELVKYRKKDIKEEKDETIKKCKMLLYRDNLENVWLYADSVSGGFNNAYLQFLNDRNKEDGIQRFYLINNQDELKNCSMEQMNPNQIILRGSLKHYEMFFRATKILTSYVEDENYWPVKRADERRRLQALFQAEVVYLQQGILHAHLPWTFSKHKSNADKIVISTDFEKENFIRNYDYAEQDLICTGMARLDYLETAPTKTGKILFAPSWRAYLVGTTGNTRGRFADESKLLNSVYYCEMKCFLQSEKLMEYLQNQNLILEYKLHPEMARVYGGSIEEIDSEYIKEAEEFPDLNEYDFLITDFSSIMYDFLYMKKPVFSVIPDIEEVKSGLHHFSKLDTDLEEVCSFCTNKYEALLEKLTGSDFMKNKESIAFLNEEGRARENLYLSLSGISKEEH